MNRKKLTDINSNIRLNNSDIVQNENNIFA